jgi:hypothetical protein
MIFNRATMSVLFVAQKKQAELPVEISGNPAISSLRPVAFRPRLATDLALPVMKLTVPTQEVKSYFPAPLPNFLPKLSANFVGANSS